MMEHLNNCDVIGWHWCWCFRSWISRLSAKAVWAKRYPIQSKWKARVLNPVWILPQAQMSRCFWQKGSSSRGNYRSLPAHHEELNLTTKRHLFCVLLKAEWVRASRWSGDKGSCRQLLQAFRSENLIKIIIWLLSRSLKKVHTSVCTTLMNAVCLECLKKEERTYCRC